MVLRKRKVFQLGNRNFWPVARPLNKHHKYSALGSALFIPQVSSVSLFEPSMVRPAKAFWGDSDGDGMVNAFDCDPYNKRRQGLMASIQTNANSLANKMRQTMVAVPVSGLRIGINSSPPTRSTPATSPTISAPGLSITSKVAAAVEAIKSGGVQPSPTQQVAVAKVAPIYQTMTGSGTSSSAPRIVQPVPTRPSSGSSSSSSSGSSRPGTSTSQQRAIPTPKMGVANPASAYAIQQGYQLQIRNGPSGQYGMAIKPDGTEIEEWALYRSRPTQPAPVVHPATGLLVQLKPGVRKDTKF